MIDIRQEERLSLSSGVGRRLRIQKAKRDGVPVAKDSIEPHELSSFVSISGLAPALPPRRATGGTCVRGEREAASEVNWN